MCSTNRDFLMSLLITTSSKSIFISLCTAKGSDSHQCWSCLIPGAVAKVLLMIYKKQPVGRGWNSRWCSRVLDLPLLSCLQHKWIYLNILLCFVLVYENDLKVKKPSELTLVRITRCWMWQIFQSHSFHRSLWTIEWGQDGLSPFTCVYTVHNQRCRTSLAPWKQKNLIWTQSVHQFL